MSDTVFFTKKGLVSGVAESASAGDELELLLNGRLLATSGISPDKSFRVNIREGLDFLCKEDGLEVKAKSFSLPIDLSEFDFIDDARKSDPSEMFEKLENGYVFTKTGHIRRALEEDNPKIKGAFDAYTRLNALMKERLGVELFLSYGTLLGAIREGGFIKNDNDIDCSFLAKSSDPKGVIAEVYEVIKLCIELNFFIRISAGKKHFQIRDRKSQGAFDIFWSWRDESTGEYRVSYGHHGKALELEDNTLELEPMDFLGFDVLVPKESEALLEQYYGEGWRIPDHGFSHLAKTRVRNPHHFIDPETEKRVYWAIFYKKNPVESGSNFAKFIAEKSEPNSLITEFGCGNGRDAIFFAKSGFDVIASDASGAAIEAAKNEMSLNDGLEITFDQCDVSDKDDIVRFVKNTIVAHEKYGESDLTVYCRFFIHAIDEESEAALLSVLASEIKKPFRFVAEFRTDQDEELPKTHGVRHYRRFVNPDAFAERLTSEHGYKIESIESGFGFSIYGDEDPHLCRVIATAN